MKNLKNINEFFQHNKWYLVKIDGEYYAEKKVKLPHSEIEQKIIFRDFNGEKMSLGEDKEWASKWIQDKNEIDELL